MKRLLFLFASIFIYSGCSKITDLQNSLTQYDGIFSNRPQKMDGYVTILKLKNPPLLSTMKVENGKKIVDAELVAAIELEQTTLIDKLAKISSEIKVINRYRLVLNGIAIAGPKEVLDSLNIPGVVVERTKGFGRPINQLRTKPMAAVDVSDGSSSVRHIGALEVHKKGITGQNIRVGVIDSGIDYTHAMLGGPGTEEAYKAIDGSQPNDLFPNLKVVGGIDLVGKDFDAASDVFENRIPKPDANPLDEGGHGTHVAGSIAGIGDNKTSYSGVAPDALLYAIKVFGADGSTSDDTVIAGLEYSADPNKDLDFNDQLHVVNLSLGSSYGTSHIMYNEAIRHLSNAGTVIVASAGNSGPKDFITGAPGAVDHAFSVAASIDNMVHNWQFPATSFALPDGQTVKTIALEGGNAKPIAEASVTEGELLFIGLADEDLTPEAAEKLKGKVAFIDRGKVPFMDKLKRAEAAGAVAVVVANNQPGEPIAMGGEGKVEIPAVMISLEAATEIKAGMEKGAVRVNLKTGEMISKPELVDTVTDFSSKGPRSIDAILKPEIAAPGHNIISALMGGGTQIVTMSGTSMSAPHIAGVMALMKQAHPQLSSLDLQSMVMGTSKTLLDKELKPVRLSLQGAGRVQVDKAVESVMATSPTAVSFGIVGLEKSKTLRKELTLKNLSDKVLNLQLSFVGHESLTMEPMLVSVDPKAEKTVAIKIHVKASAISTPVTEVDGFIQVAEEGQQVFKIALLMLAEKVSNIKASAFTVEAGSFNDAPGSVVELKLKNSSDNEGEALLFNKINDDGRKPAVNGIFMSRICDLQAAGYRIVGDKVQFAIKLYEPITSWEMCEVSVLIDSDNDQLAEQELVGTVANRLEGVTVQELHSILLDATQARQIRKDYEATLPQKPDEVTSPNYTPAILAINPMVAFHNSTVAIIEVEKELLKTRPSGELAVKIATSSGDEYNTEWDDFLGSEKQWKKIDITEKSQGFMGLPASVKVPGNQETTVEFTKGHGRQDLMVLFPQNMHSLGTILKDEQVVFPPLKLKAQ